MRFSLVYYNPVQNKTENSKRDFSNVFRVVFYCFTVLLTPVLDMHFLEPCWQSIKMPLLFIKSLIQLTQPVKTISHLLLRFLYVVHFRICTIHALKNVDFTVIKVLRRMFVHTSDVVSTGEKRCPSQKLLKTFRKRVIFSLSFYSFLVVDGFLLHYFHTSPKVGLMLQDRFHNSHIGEA